MCGWFIFPPPVFFRSSGMTIQTGRADVLEMKFMGEFNGVKSAINAVGAAKHREKARIKNSIGVNEALSIIIIVS